MHRHCTIRRTRSHACKGPRTQPRHRNLIRSTSSMPRVEATRTLPGDALPPWVRLFIAPDGSPLLAIVAADPSDRTPEILVTAWLYGEPVSMLVIDTWASKVFMDRDDLAAYYVEVLQSITSRDAREWFRRVERTLLRVGKRASAQASSAFGWNPAVREQRPRLRPSRCAERQGPVLRPLLGTRLHAEDHRGR